MRRIPVALAIVSSLVLGWCARKPTLPPDGLNVAELAAPPEAPGHDTANRAADRPPEQQLDESRCRWLLRETGVDIPSWTIRVAIAFTTIVSVAGSLLAVSTGVSGRPLIVPFGLAVLSGLGLGGTALLAERGLTITDTSRSGFWPRFARHLIRWIQLAGPRFAISLLTFTLSVLYISWAAQPNTAELDRSIYAGVISALWIISGSALVTIFFEYRRQLRLLRRSAEPIILALQNGVAVPPEEVSRLLMSLSYGVAASHTGTIGLIDAARARSAIAIYSATRSPGAIATIIDEAYERLGLARPLDARARERIAQQQIESAQPAERLRANELLGHPTATADTRRIAFEWLNDQDSLPLPTERLLSSLPRTET